MSNSFYGGIKGESFKISRIFQNKAMMEADLNKGYTSSYGVGSYVMVSYGIQNRKVISATKLSDVNLNNLQEGDYVVINNSSNTNFDIVYTKKDNSLVESFSVSTGEFKSYSENKDIDLKKYGKTFNGSLWQKVYINQEDLQNTSFRYISDIYQGQIEESEVLFIKNANFGVGYKLISSIVGEIPVFSLKDTIVLPPKDNPKVEINVISPDNPQLQFSLPRAIKFYATTFSATSYKKTIQVDEPTEDGGTTTVEKEIDVSYVVGDKTIIPLSSVTLEEGDKIEEGDYFFNGKSAWIFKVEEVKTEGYYVKFCARFNVEPPKFNVIMKEPFVPTTTAITGDTFEATFDNTIDIAADANNPEGWTQNVTVPKYPDIELKVNKIGPLAENSASQKYIYDNSKPGTRSRLQITANIARGSRIITLRYSINQYFPNSDGKIDKISIPQSVETTFSNPQKEIIETLKYAELGDIIIDKSGMIYEFSTVTDNKQVWNYYNTNLKGDSAAVNFYNANSIMYNSTTETDTSNLDYKTGNNTINTTTQISKIEEYIKTILDNKYKVVEDVTGNITYPEISVGDIFPFICTDAADSGNKDKIIVYWACYSVSGWSIEMISSGNSVVVNEYDANASKTMAYSTAYVNDLINNNEIGQAIQKERKTYSASMIEKKITGAVADLNATLDGRIEPNGGFIIIDDVTREKYKVGISNGKMFYEKILGE